MARQDTVQGLTPHQQNEPGEGRSAVQLWNVLVQQLLDQGYSTFNAYETADATVPGLWQAAVAEVARTSRQAVRAGKK